MSKHFIIQMAKPSLSTNSSHSVNKLAKKLCAFVLLALLALAATPDLRAQGTLFTYQGRLNTNGVTANGTFGFRFKLFSDLAGNNQVGSTFLTNSVSVSGGLFTAGVNFGAGIFTGSNYFLLIGVSTNGGSTFTDLSPLQPVTPTPYAIMADTASNLLGKIATTQLTGTVGNVQLANSALTVSAGTGLSGGGSVALGSSITLNNAGVLSVSSGGDITANTAAGAVTLGSDATSASTPNTIVKRDATGSFSATNVNATNVSIATGKIFESGQLIFFNDTLNQNLFAGASSGNATMTGVQNTSFGASALSSDTIGLGNAAFGFQALLNNTSASGNTALGIDALNNTITGGFNTAVGVNALFFNTTGSNNVAVGMNALEHLDEDGDTTINNIAVGFGAGINLVDGSSNIYIGNPGAFSDNNTIRIGTPGIQSLAVIAGTITGDGGGLTNLSGSQIVAQAHNNLFVGPNAGNPGITGSENTGMGIGVLSNNTSGVQNTAFGKEALQLNTTGRQNVAVGFQALLKNTSGTFNTAVGAESLEANTSGQNNTAEGADVLILNTTGTNNTALGAGALGSSVTGSQNTAVGELALVNLGNFSAGGSNNIAVGTLAGSSLLNNESGNIDIGNNGVAAENNIIRIGSNQVQAFIAGTITGDGGGLTNLNSAKLTGAVPSASLTSVPAASLTGAGTLPVGVLPSSVALLNANQTFSGIDTFPNGFNVNTGAGTVIFTNDQTQTAGFLATGGPNPGVIRVRNTLQLFPNQAGTSAGSLDVRNTSGAATLTLNGATGSLTIDQGNANLGTVASALTFGSGSGEGIGSMRSGNFSDSFGLNFYTSFSKRITILNNGNVGIGTTNADSLLTVNGTADKPGGGSWNTFSDARLKDVGPEFTHGLADLNRIQPVHYHYKSDNPLNLPSQPEHIGVVAQQVREAIPEAVEETKSGYLSVNNDPIIWTMVNAIKELKTENESLKQRLEQLEKQQVAAPRSQ